MNAQHSTAFQLPLDDTLNYKIHVSKAVPRGDVTVTVAMELLVSTRSESSVGLDDVIRTALQDFIPVQWELLGHERTSATPGFERIRLKALSTVPPEQNRNLEERARKANREGLEFGEISIKRSLPQGHANQIVKELWFDAISKVSEHLPEFNRVSGRTWRIGDVVLGVSAGTQRIVRGKGGFTEEIDTPLGSLGEVIEAGMSGVEKISLIADVTLKSERPASVLAE
jgi:hypothetical protein